MMGLFLSYRFYGKVNEKRTIRAYAGEHKEFEGKERMKVDVKLSL
jgi:hypothetical protein